MKTTKITALYCRISREDEHTDISSSIETQKSYLKRYANEHRMLFTKYHIDDGFSGTNFVRPGSEFSKLVKWIVRGKLLHDILFSADSKNNNVLFIYDWMVRVN